MSVIDNSTAIGTILEWANNNQDDAILFSSIAGGGILLLMIICCVVGALSCRRTLVKYHSRKYDAADTEEL